MRLKPKHIGIACGLATVCLASARLWISSRKDARVKAQIALLRQQFVKLSSDLNSYVALPAPRTVDESEAQRTNVRDGLIKSLGGVKSTLSAVKRLDVNVRIGSLELLPSLLASRIEVALYERTLSFSERGLRRDFLRKGADRPRLLAAMRDKVVLPYRAALKNFESFANSVQDPAFAKEVRALTEASTAPLIRFENQLAAFEIKMNVDAFVVVLKGRGKLNVDRDFRAFEKAAIERHGMVSAALSRPNPKFNLELSTYRDSFRMLETDDHVRGLMASVDALVATTRRARSVSASTRSRLAQIDKSLEGARQDMGRVPAQSAESAASIFLRQASGGADVCAKPLLSLGATAKSNEISSAARSAQSCLAKLDHRAISRNSEFIRRKLVAN